MLRSAEPVADTACNVRQFLGSFDPPSCQSFHRRLPDARGMRCSQLHSPAQRQDSQDSHADHGFDYETKAKRVLLRRLGLLKEDEMLTNDVLTLYTKLFEQPLVVDVVQAFADFYGSPMPPTFLRAWLMIYLLF
ncbi:hypothetical protein D1007_29207 [Hordeum vulgare]|nr:hypothetical protein D1007_29207 [Hordeum vulgare]